MCLLIGFTVSGGALSSKNVDPSRPQIADGPRRQKHSAWGGHDSRLQQPWNHRGGDKPAAVPPYAVKMEPVAHYSEHDPLYSSGGNATAKIDYGGHAVPGTAAADIGIVSSDYGAPGPSLYAAPYQPDYYKEPEPIIEIIIKESNESLPAPPTPPPAPAPKPSKEPVQVFYVKYKKNPNSYGDKEDIIYERPVPALTPSTEEVGESETVYSTEPSPPIYSSYVTGPPAPSTTFRTIIKPDSEVYHGTGLKVTFGKSEESWSPSLNEAQKRDSVSEASNVQNKVKKHADHEFKRSFVQPSPQPTDYQRNINSFEAPPINSQPQFNGFSTPKPNNELLPQQQYRKPNQQVSNYFREDGPRPNFQGQIPILNQQLKSQQNHFEGAVEQRPIEFKDNFRSQQFANQPNYQQFNNVPSVQQFTNQPTHQPFNNQPNHQQFTNQQNHHQQLNNQQSHRQFNNQQFSNQQNHQQFNNQQNHQQFNNQQFSNQPRQPEFQSSPPPRNPGSFQERPAQIKLNNERPFLNKPFETHLPQSKPFENRPLPDRPFDNRPFESRPIPDRPFESRPIHDNRPFDNRGPVHSRPIENRPIQDRPLFDNRQNQGPINYSNYRPSKPPTPQNIPLSPNPSFVPSDRRPTVPPPQLPSSYNTQPISTKHTLDLAFPPQQQQQLQQQQHQQQQLQQQQQHQQQYQQPFQQQYRPSESRPLINIPTFHQQSIKQQFTADVKPTIPQYQQQTAKQQPFAPESKPSQIPQIQITQSNSFKLEPNVQQQPAQSGQFVETFARYQPTQTEQSFRTDNTPWQVSNHQGSFNVPSPDYKEHISASTIQNAIDMTSSKSFLKTTEKPATFSTAQYKERSTTTPTSTSTAVPFKPTTTEAAKNETKKTDFKNIAALPDEVPDELREQLLSSGILGNADIQILDYDKVGDIPIESLPPEALENLYGQGSDPVPSVVLPPNKADVQMKIIKYDPTTEEGKKIEDKYTNRPKSQTLDPVALNDTGYNRFLPLNINGTHFPIPDSPLLKNKAIESVVILSPVGYDLSDDQSRSSRNTAVQVKGVHFVVGNIVKNLVKNPSKENFETWLKIEKSTPSSEQSVVLLVTK